MLVTTAELPDYRRRVAMVDGGFDPLHAGHIAYFRGASELGAPVLCNVSGDDWVGRKHVPLLPQEERGAVLDAIRWIDYVHLARAATRDVLAALEPRYYVKGADWRGRMPDDELKLCAERGIELIYLETILNSSTAILDRYVRDARG